MRELRRRPDLGERVPPGQYVTEKWPVLHYGGIPRFDQRTWDFQISGLVETPVALSYEKFMALSKTTLKCDIHCVTAWSKLDVVFEGVPVKPLLEMAKPKAEAKFVMVHAEQGYETNLPIEYLLADDALLAHRANGADLAPEHGWPLRLVVPRLYFWKSAKWVRGFEVIERDRRGFWERNGYHTHADPWKEERYSSP